MKKMLYTPFLIDHITRNDGGPSRDPPKRRGGGHEGPIMSMVDKKVTLNTIAACLLTKELLCTYSVA